MKTYRFKTSPEVTGVHQIIEERQPLRNFDYNSRDIYNYCL